MPSSSKNASSPLVEPASQRYGPALVLCLLAVATALKFYWARNSVGSGDVLLFYKFAKSLQRFSLAQFYSLEPLFNHTPLAGVFLRGIFALSKSNTGTALDRLEDFAFYLRACCILADIGVVLILLRIKAITKSPDWLALGAFALSPVSLMISGFHGNIDPILTLALVGTTAACLEGNAVISGLLFGLACSVKAVALPLMPIFFFYWWSRRGAWRFLGSSLAVLALGFGPVLLQAPVALLHNVFGYSSSFGSWGITYWIKKSRWEPVRPFAYQGLTLQQMAIATVLKLCIIAGITALSWRRRHATGIQLVGTVAGCWAIFFVFASGIGGQYLVWCAPFLLLYSVRWWAVITAGATVMLAVFYQSVSYDRFPWVWANPGTPETPQVDPWAVILWLLFVAFLVVEGPRLWFEGRAEAQPSEGKPHGALGFRTCRGNDRELHAPERRCEI